MQSRAHVNYYYLSWVTETNTFEMHTVTDTKQKEQHSNNVNSFNEIISFTSRNTFIFNKHHNIGISFIKQSILLSFAFTYLSYTRCASVTINICISHN